MEDQIFFQLPPERKLAIDLEAVNEALDLEMNPELSTQRIAFVLEKRLEQLSRSEVSKLPQAIWGSIDRLSSDTNLRRYNPNVPKRGDENGRGWLQVRLQTPDIYHVIPQGCGPDELLKSLKSKPRYARWVEVNSPCVVRVLDRLTFQAPILSGLSEPFVTRIFEDF